MGKKNPVEEARRYVDNAKTLLIENGELDTETRSYNDRKLGYDGTRVKDTCDAAFRMANDIIDRCAVMLSA